MPKIKNKEYREFLEKGIIKTIDIEDLKNILSNLDYFIERRKNKQIFLQQFRNYIILAYYTGARPIEILNLKRKDVEKEKTYLKIFFRTYKHGRARTIYLSISKPFIKEFWESIKDEFDEMFIFYELRGNRKRFYKTRKGKEIMYIDITYKIYYYFRKIFSIPPYYFRHNRFSKLAMRGGKITDLILLKGSKSEASVFPYLHMSSSEMKKLQKKID